MRLGNVAAPCAGHCATCWWNERLPAVQSETGQADDRPLASCWTGQAHASRSPTAGPGGLTPAARQLLDRAGSRQPLASCWTGQADASRSPAAGPGRLTPAARQLLNRAGLRRPLASRSANHGFASLDPNLSSFVSNSIDCNSNSRPPSMTISPLPQRGQAIVRSSTSTRAPQARHWL
jgi:hypothetical protein